MVVTNDGLGNPHIAAYGQGIRSIWCKGSFLKLCISTQCKEAKRQRKLVISMVSVICPLCFRVTGGSLRNSPSAIHFLLVKKVLIPLADSCGGKSIFN